MKKNNELKIGHRSSWRGGHFPKKFFGLRPIVFIRSSAFRGAFGVGNASILITKLVKNVNNL